MSLYTVIIYITQCIVANAFSKVSWTEPIRLYEFQSYSSVNLFHYNIPSATAKASWIFKFDSSHEDCEKKNGTVYFRYGSYPIIENENVREPPTFNSNNGIGYNLTIHVNLSKTFEITSPHEGDWFAAAYINPDNVAKKFVLKGLHGGECKYFLSSQISFELQDDVKDITLNSPNVMFNTKNESRYFRFFTNFWLWRLEFNIINCSSSSNNTDVSEECPLYVISKARSLPKKSNATDDLNDFYCQNENCSFSFDNPLVNTWYYVLIQNMDESNNVSFILQIFSKECGHYFTQEQTVGNSTQSLMEDASQENVANDTTLVSHGIKLNDALNQTYLNYDNDTNLTEIDQQRKHHVYIPRNETCILIPELGRFSSKKTFNSNFQLRYMSIALPNEISINDIEPLILQTEIKPFLDSGGTLDFRMNIGSNRKDENMSYISEVKACISQYKIPVDENGLNCNESNLLVVNSSTKYGNVMYFQYPVPGYWFVALLATCYESPNGTNGSLEIITCPETVDLLFHFKIQPCKDGSCGKYGACKEYFSGILHFSACRCTSNYKGLDCSDGAVAVPYYMQLLGILLLTISNVGFLPAICLSLYRGFLSEAIVYSFVMVFSTLYHACDGDETIKYCVIHYNVLQQCDFYGAVMSMWVTIIAMARLTDRRKTYAYIAASLGLSVGVAYDRWSVWLFGVPVATGIIVIIVSWGYRCRDRKSCYPSKLRYLMNLLPGISLVIIGCCLFAFFETDSNYKYIHSFWHICMALAIVFLLPKRQQGVKGEYDFNSALFEDSDSSAKCQSCCSTDNVDRSNNSDTTNIISKNEIHTVNES